MNYETNIKLWHEWGVLRTYLFHRQPAPRGEIRIVDYTEADRLIRSGDWKLAIPEEDYNHVFNRVYLEKKINP
jgi:hypothetical protein